MMSTVNVDVEKAETLIKAAKDLTDTKELMENKAADVKQKLTSLAELPKLKDRLQNAKIPAAKSQVAKIDECMTTLKTWAAEVLLPDKELIGILDRIAEFARKASPFGPEGATGTEAAKAFTGKLPELPEFISQPFLVRCSLAFKSCFWSLQFAGMGWTAD